MSYPQPIRAFISTAPSLWINVLAIFWGIELVLLINISIFSDGLVNRLLIQSRDMFDYLHKGLIIIISLKKSNQTWGATCKTGSRP